MAIINTKLIKYATQARFDIDIAKVPAVIDSKSIVFVEDTGRIYAHGKYFGGAWEDITDKPSTYTPSAHTHGPITNDGKIGTLTNRIIETTTGGLLTHVAKKTAYNKAFGTESGTVAQGNDSRINNGQSAFTRTTNAGITGAYLSNITELDTPPVGARFISSTPSTHSSYPAGMSYPMGIEVGRSASVSAQLVIGHSNSGTNGNMAFRSKSGASMAPWRSVWDNVNLTKLTQLTNDLPNFNRTVAGLVPAPGAATTTRYLREDGSWFVPPNTGDTHWTTGIRAGASGTNSNSAANDPFIKVLDNTTYRSQVQILGGTNITANSDATGKITIDGAHNHTLKLIAGNSTATTNSTADVANPYIRLFSDNVHQGNIQIVGGTNVGVVSKNGVITFTSTNTTYSAGTLALLQTGTNTSNRVWSSKILNDWLNPKLDSKFDKTGGILSGIIENSKNGLRLGNRVFQGNYPTSHTGIRSLVIPSRGERTVFNVAINIYGHSAKYQGRFVFGFYKQSLTAIATTTGNIGYFTGTTNFPFKDIHAGIDINGNVRINMGNSSTSWGGYVSIDVEKSENFYSNYNENWGDGWTIDHIIGEPSDFQSIVEIPISEGITGNASTATTLQTARTINGTSFDGSANIITARWGTDRTLTIGSTGKSVNGSGNVSWSLAEIGAAPSSHSHNYLDIYGNSNYYTKYYITAPDNDFDNITNSLSLSAGANGPFGGAYAYLQNFIYSTASQRAQLAISYTSNPGRMAFRTLYGGVWRGWYEVLHSGNYNDYAPTKTGGGASGTWGISVTGNASSASAVLTSAENTGTTSRYILFANSASGNQALKTDSGLKYVPSTNTISANISGNLTGNVTGDVTGDITGSAGSTANWAGNTYTNSNITNEVYLMTSTNGTVWRRTLANRYVDTTSTQNIGGVKSFTNNVGIGTNDPSAMLEVKGPTDGVIVVSTGANSSTQSNNINFKWHGNPGYHSGIKATAAGNTSNLYFLVRSGTTTPEEKMTLMSSGNLGIGTTSPAYKLDVSGTGRFTGNVTGAGFSKTGATDAHVLLGSGGHKSISDFNASLVTSTTTSGISNVATSNTNTYLNIVQGGVSSGSSTQIMGSNGVSVSSNTSGRVTIAGVGDFRDYGLGSNTSVNKNPDDFGSMSSGFYGVSTGAVGNPVPSSSGTLIHLRSPASGNNYWAQLHVLANGTATARAFISHGQTTRAAGWEELYHTGNFANGTTSQYIRGDGSLATYKDTTYSTGTLAQLNAGTDTTGRLQTAKLLNDWLNPKLNDKLDKSGGTLSGNLFIPRNVSIIQHQNDTSNYTTAIKWYKGGVSQNTYDPQIGHHSTGGGGDGSITILPYATDIEPWGGAVGLHLTKTAIKFNNNTIYHSGNFATGTTAQYIRGDGSLATYANTTYSEITEAEINAGTASTLRTITGRRLKYAFDNITAANATNATNATNTTNINTVADNSSNASRFILFSDAAAGNQRAKTDTGLKYNPSSNTITATLAGNASSATALTTSAGSATRPIYFSGGKPVQGTYTFGNASGNAPISNGVVNVNLNAAMLAGYTPSSFLLSRRMTNPSDGTSEQGAIPFILALKAAGRPVYTDPEFSSGNNSVSRYDNGGQGSVSITRVSNTSAANSSGYVLEIATTSGAAGPGRGGFYQSITARANAVFCQIFRAKIPVGFSVNNAENSMGTGSTTHWLTDKNGTGKWEWYCRVTICGPTGTFSGGGHVYLVGSGAVTWQLAYCNVIDLSKGEYDGLRTRFADSADTATKLGTATVGSTQLPIYLNAGTATAITRANLRIGLFGATAIGSTTRPIYIAANGVPTAITGSIANSTTGNAATATKLASITTTFTGTYPVTFNVNGAIYSHTGITYTGSTGALTATSFIGNASSATKVNNKLILKFDTGTTENTNLYTYDGSAAKTIDIKAGSNVSLTKTANTITISSTNTNTTYSAMSVAEGKAGTATSSRTVRADYLKQIIQHWDTNSVTGIRVGASGTTANTAVTSPYIKVVDDTSYREQFRLIGGSNVTITSDASKNITITAAGGDDTKVTQTADSTASYRPFLLGHNTATNTANFANTTNLSYYTNKIRVQPSTGNIISSGTVTAGNLKIDNIFNLGTSWEIQGYTGNIEFSHGATRRVYFTNAGQIHAGSFYQTSDIRLKNVLGNINIDIKKAMSLPTFYFKYKNNPNKREIGTSAQEVQKLFPELVDTNSDGILSVQYDKLSLIALELIKNQYKELETVKKELEILKRKLNV